MTLRGMFMIPHGPCPASAGVATACPPGQPRQPCQHAGHPALHCEAARRGVHPTRCARNLLSECTDDNALPAMPQGPRGLILYRPVRIPRPSLLNASAPCGIIRDPRAPRRPDDGLDNRDRERDGRQARRTLRAVRGRRVRRDARLPAGRRAVRPSLRRRGAVGARGNRPRRGVPPLSGPRTPPGVLLRPQHEHRGARGALGVRGALGLRRPVLRLLPRDLPGDPPDPRAGPRLRGRPGSRRPTDARPGRLRLRGVRDRHDGRREGQARRGRRWGRGERAGRLVRVRRRLRRVHPQQAGGGVPRVC